MILDNVIHNNLFYYNKSGYGGKQIKRWPFYNFIKIWVEGNHDQARDLWIDWLVSEFNKYCKEEKSNGGMYQGSMHRYTLNYINKNKYKYWHNPSLIGTTSIKLGATLLVDKRIKLIKSIIKNGYHAKLNDPVIAVRKKNFYELKGGHHRAAIMYALKQDKLPRVKIYSKQIWEIRKWLIKIKKFLNLKI